MWGLYDHGEVIHNEAYVTSTWEHQASLYM